MRLTCITYITFITFITLVVTLEKSLSNLRSGPVPGHFYLRFFGPQRLQTDGAAFGFRLAQN
jgi:hypothetical protein